MNARLGVNLDQDWDVVQVHKKAPTRKPPSSATVSQVRAAGVAVETQKKYDAGRNRAVKPHPVVDARKLENEEEAMPLPSVSRDISLAIQQARLAKKWTQAQLAQKINERAGIINDYERGAGVPNPSILTKLERVLGVKLTGRR